MKSLARLLIIHVFISIFLFFALISGAVSHTVLLLLLLLLLFLPALNKGLEKIQSKRIPVLNAALFFLLISFPQLLTNPVQWKFSIFLVVTIISSLAYFYNFYQVVKEVDQKQLI
ncbi:membrane protein [Streptococcus pneumoniae]|nr:membrane protein [Streptococcus pneumoniae]VMR17659.1 membrane protein [Streptococcus pneumoniae]VOL14249.1 membrane protein [Streptococcus pneumoniae]